MIGSERNLLERFAKRASIGPVLVLGSAIGIALASPCIAQAKPNTMPAELDVLKNAIGTWDAKIEVWPQGTDSPSMKFEGVETNRGYGEHWLASDFESEFGGENTSVHSIIGYDLDKGTLVGTVIDHGPYAATMTGEYDAETGTVHWTTKGRDPAGDPILQKTSVTQKGPDERVLVLTVPGKDNGKFVKFMEIRYVRRKG
jgi:hypothetical protein